MPPTPVVGVIMGSDSDWPVLSETAKLLAEFGVGFSVDVLSAHRTPDEAARWAATAEERGLKVLVAAAGGAAHLAGVVAGHTTLPVIGVPLAGWALDGLDSLLSMVQMPGGVPVATVSIGKAGARNAAILAVEILAISDASLRAKLAGYRAKMRAEVAAKSAKVAAEARQIAGQ
ncbi:MAG TPA: 5-(carboxyamino)imidazole ribonucleotide mutase [Candidatus Brocadiia bacterium]|nr:5-(carboxyamino)imidazole ribonucleotide mutase [Candidatus Brocadiia bacterium]